VKIDAVREATASPAVASCVGVVAAPTRELRDAPGSSTTRSFPASAAADELGGVFGVEEMVTSRERRRRAVSSRIVGS